MGLDDSFDEEDQALVITMEGYMATILAAAGSDPLTSTGATTMREFCAEFLDFKARLQAVGVDETTVA